MPRTSTFLLALAAFSVPALAQSTLGPTPPTGYSQDGYPQQYAPQQVPQYAPQQQGYPQQYSPQQAYPQPYAAQQAPPQYAPQQQGYPQQGYADPNGQGYSGPAYSPNDPQVVQQQTQVLGQAPVQTDSEMVVPAPYAYPPAVGYAVPYPYPVGVGIGFGFGYPGYVYRGYPYYRGYIGRPGFYGGYRGGYAGGYRGGYAHFSARGGRR